MSLHGGQNNADGVRQTESVQDNTENGGGKVNQYVIKNALGKGAFGSVVQVVDEYSGEVFAMKIIDKQMIKKKLNMSTLRRPPTAGKPPGAAPAANADPLEGIHREVAIMKQLVHPNIIRLVEVLDNSDSAHLFMVMEIAERGMIMNFKDCNESITPLPADTCRRYFHDLLLGLEFLHVQNIVHRDLKPENLLICGDGKLKIADFGVSQTGDEFRSNAGSPPCFAPESLGPKTATTSFSAKKADIWAAGVCLYCMVYGMFPFRATNQLDLFDNIREKLVEYPANTHPDLLNLLMLLLEKDPSKRITIDEAKKHPWVTDNGKVILPTIAQHCVAKVNMEQSEEEMLNSITKLSGFQLAFVMMKAGANFKKGIKSRSSADAGDSRKSSVQSIDSRKSSVQSIDSRKSSVQSLDSRRSSSESQ